MGRVLGFVSLIIVVGIGSYIYMRQTQSAITAAGGGSNPTAAVDLIGVRQDLISIAQAERSYGSLNGKYVSLEELRSQGALAMDRNSRGPYTYSAQVSEGGFRIVATYNGPSSSGMPKSLSVDQSMEVQQER